jgi:hypothetical protein
MTYTLTYGDYAPDMEGVSVQEHIKSLEDWRNLCIDAESDARQKALVATVEITKLKNKLDVYDDDL